MKFSIEISGTQNEGPEANVRFEKLTSSFVDSLRSGGFIVEEVDAAPDVEGKPSEILRLKGLNKGITTDPDPASWQAAVMSMAARAPAKEEANTVEELNANAVSKAAERELDAKAAVTKAGETKLEKGEKDPRINADALAKSGNRGDEGADVPAAVIEADKELEKKDDPKLHLAPGDMTLDEISTFLTKNDYTVAELDAAIEEERGAKNRDRAVKALEKARDERIKAASAEAEVVEPV